MITLLLLSLSCGLKWCKERRSLFCVTKERECSPMYEWSIESETVYIGTSQNQLLIYCEIPTILNVIFEGANDLKLVFDKNNIYYNVTRGDIDDNKTNNKLSVETLKRSCNLTENCEECSAVEITTVCVRCKTDHYLINGFCFKCGINCIICEDSTGNCLKCITDYFTDNGLCMECPKQCSANQCLSDGCTKCMDGFLLIDKNCFKCKDPCYHCSGTLTSCTACKTEMYLEENTCKSCQYSCVDKKCNHDNGCTSCKVNFVLIGRSCYPCYDGCIQCTGKSYNQCTVCQNNYYLSGGECRQCDNNCNNCSTIEGCKKCNTYYFVKEKRCTKCPDNCFTCTSELFDSCTECVEGFYLEGGECKTCDTNCQLGKCSPTFGCTSCKDGFYNTSLICKSCDSSCLTCSESGTNSCLSCRDGVSFLVGNTCLSCVLNCSPGKCSNTTGCTMCINGYYVQNKMCFKCDLNCATCENFSTNCTSCDETYYLQNGKCLRCHHSCVPGNCQQSTGCTECEPRFYQYNMTCFSCDDTCYQCNGGSNTNCISCLEGISFLENGQCITCDKKCKNNRCHNSEGCTSCEDKYFVKNKRCVSCHSTCKTCVGELETDCNSCEKGWYLDNSKCLSCDTNCKQENCDVNNGCQICEFGYFPNNKKCSPCNSIANCVECNQSVGFQCTKCGDRFQVVNYSCQCPNYLYQNSQNTCSECYNFNDNCQLCTNQDDFSSICTNCFKPYILTNSKCKLCMNGYYYSNKKCFVNDDGCERQIENGHCVKCNSSFYLRENKCLPIIEKCLTNSIIKCQDCLNGISIDSNCGLYSECKYYLKQIIKNQCLQCFNNQTLINGNCSVVTNSHFIINNVIIKCDKNEYLNNTNLCTQCKNSLLCNFENSTIKDILCDKDKVIDTTEIKCVENNKCDLIISSDCIQCKLQNSFISMNQCSACNDNNCKLCTKKYCVKCKSEYLLVNSNNCQHINSFMCVKSNSQNCIQCDISYVRSGKNNETTSYCQKLENNIKYALIRENNTSVTIKECENNYYLFENECTYGEFSTISKSEKETNCQVRTQKGCVSCLNGFYLNHETCVKCINDCLNCVNDSYCLTCDKDTHFLNVYSKCESTTDLNKKCKLPMPQNIGCAICNDSFYREKNDCLECHRSCKTCKSKEKCISCQENYYYISSESSLCQPYDTLTFCINKTQSGCVECQIGYYLDNYVPRCRICMNNCTSCLNQNSCFVCNEDNVYINNTCVHFSNIKNCISSKNNYCSMCVDGKKVGGDELSCENQVNLGLAIGLPVMFMLLIIITISVIIVGLFYLYQHFKEQKKMQNVCVFKMSRSNVIFYKVNDWLVSNKEILIFEDEDNVNKEICVGKETRELLCVGNKSNHVVKLQFSVMKGCDYYTIQTEPKLVHLKSGEACEFEIFLTPLCSCKIEEQIVCIGLDIQKGVEMTDNIKISAKTQLTTRLDYHELHEQKKLGEGSFGIVYLGEFRGLKVAIKKLREGCSDEGKVREFEKEVQMLDKFRSDYLVHFYGAVFIPNKICMVTEFATFGSLNDLMKKKREQSPRMAVKMKFMLDMANGIVYLHSNGIVHRDIKPDNLLVFSLDLGTTINAKLTDFGSARNINMLMTNMTFTKGVGTPKYMSPEVLNKEKYKMPSDIFSFAISMYECFTWKDPYPKEFFKFAWSIADFVASGKHLPKVECIDEKIYSLLEINTPNRRNPEGIYRESNLLVIESQMGKQAKDKASKKAAKPAVNNFPDILMPSAEDIKMMVACRVHIGATNENYAMKGYVYEKGTNGECIFNLMKTWEKLSLAARVIAGISIENPSDVVAVAGREMAHRASLKFMKYTGCTSVVGRFTAGTFTNQIQKKFMEPRVIIVSDPAVDSQALLESGYINVPTIAFCNSDSDTTNVDIAIPCNNRSRLSIGLMWWMLTREILRFRGELARDKTWEVVVDLFLHRELDAKKEVSALADNTEKKEENVVAPAKAEEKKEAVKATVASSEWEDQKKEEKKN
ncbi:40S ribosomal protein sa, putative [Entamoeba invadens IP1]|uniref:Small ribosomal subunit protein uS2 n=2 Tax=Entamoeba invadens TaxID=33085 RepID=A0A0A1U865_ENTIV|nr:40S ribosomal protein sa, putative [Entamoeba invadens IP1]ELP91093.1 40S ribosomal protein sa, putative [Entamoeba invadens IP1]|eukprot:XP_004257864.1 40S ribosomal protein sa, putative [Entamoeba invadens IP1]